MIFAAVHFLSARRAGYMEHRLEGIRGEGQRSLSGLGIFEPVELRQTGLEREHWRAEEADER